MADTSIPPAIIYSAGGALASAITAMWFWFRSNFKTVERKLQDCEDDREALWKKIATLTGEAVRAQTCPAPKCPVRMSLEWPHRSVAARREPPPAPPEPHGA